MSTKYLLIILSFLTTLTVEAAIQKSTASVRRPNPILLGAGSVKGGKAGVGFTLIGANSKVAKSKKIERFSLDVGTRTAEKLSGPIAYFNVQNDPTGKKIIIDFAQTLNTKFEESHLRKIFSQSPFVRNAEMIFEPQSQTTSMVLNLKKPAAVRVIPVSGNKHRTAKLVLDIFDQQLVKKTVAPKAIKR